MNSGTIKSYTFPPACAQCAQEGLTCCYYRNDTITDMILPISYTECTIISSFLGISSITTCFDEERITERFQTRMKAMFPAESEAIERIFPIGATRFRFALRGEIKRCVFLTPRGCLLPRSVRPVLCKLFPFWVYTNGEISLFGTCKLTPQGGEMIEWIQNASTSIVELYALYNLLRMYWGL